MQPHLESGVGATVLCHGTRDEEHLELQRPGMRLIDFDEESIGRECLVEEREALICHGGAIARLHRSAYHSGPKCRRGRGREVAIDEHIARDAGQGGRQLRGRRQGLHGRRRHEARALERAQIRVLPVLIP